MKILIGIIIGLVALAIIALVAFHIYIKVAFDDFYKVAQPVFTQPGISSGFIPQDVCLAESDQDSAAPDPANATWLFSGYEDKDDQSPIYRRTADGTVTKFYMRLPNGQIYDGHGGGLSANDRYLYVTNHNGYIVCSLAEALQVDDGAVIDALGIVELGLTPAFLNIQDGIMRAGVFYYEGPYSTPDYMHLTAPDGTKTYAVMYEFEPDPSAEFDYSKIPDKVYAIPDKVQGVAINGNDEMVFSTSWGLNASHLLSYTVSKMRQSGTYDVGSAEIPLFFADDSCLAGDFSIPPMSEGIIYSHGKLYISCESASNKYIFGKIYGAEPLYALPM